LENRRRLFLTEAGEPLLLAKSAMSIVERFSEFTDYTGLDRNQIAANPLAAIPFPVMSRANGPRGWPINLNPASMWHPLFWLPERLAFRYRFEGDDIEDENEWVVRVALETTISDLYNPIDGTWFDVLAYYDLDSDDPQVQARISAWLAGGDDDVLDSIDLTETVDEPGNEHWAVESTAEMLPTLIAASWATLADDLAQSTGALITDVTDRAEALEAAETLVNLALGTLSDVPGVSEQEPAPHLRWQEIARALTTSTKSLDELLRDEIDELSESFYAIRDDYWPYVVLLQEEIAAQSGEPALV
jgi:hypothetical protein